jgi:uncharacterized protein YbjT (DUF2867 family)
MSSAVAPPDVFVTGGTGYLGRRLIPLLARRGRRVRALVRPGSERKLPPDCEAVQGDALDRESIAARVRPARTFVHLVGVPHPSPAKAQQFREVDLVSVRAAVAAAVDARVEHFVYVSVAQPAPLMKAYLEVRAEGERLIRESSMKATILRPWYVLGPGHRWAYVLVPLYKVLESMPATSEGARRLGLVTLPQMLRALVAAVETVPDRVRIVTVPEIRRAAPID